MTNLTVTPNKINDGQNAKVRVDFDDKKGKIERGDTINVSWTIGKDVQIQGYNKTIPLVIHGKKVGEAVITPNGATITFNEEVDNLNDVSGFVEFEVQGRNMTNTTESDDKVATIKIWEQTKDITIHKDAAGTESVFYYKTGDMQPNDTDHVRWFLNINNEKRPVVKDITIKDQIQSGQQLDLNSFSIRVQGTHPGYYSGAAAIEEFQKRIPGAKISVDAVKNTIDVFIPRGYASYNNFTVYYKTKGFRNQILSIVCRNIQIYYQFKGFFHQKTFTLRVNILIVPLNLLTLSVIKLK